MKKTLATAVLLMTVAVTAISGCSSSNTSSNATSNASTSQPSSNVTTATPAPEQEKVTLKIWDIYPDAGAFKDSYTKVIKEWNDSNPNIQLVTETSGSEPYKTKIKTAMAANDLPDIFYTWDAGFAQPFVESGRVLALDDYLKDGTKDKLNTGTLANMTYDGKVYALPFTQAIGTFYVNKELFEKNNVKIPTTYTELKDAVKAFVAKGITPMTAGGKDRWPLMFYYDIMALREGGTQLNMDALYKKASFDQAPFQDAAQKIQELVSLGAFGKDYFAASRDESEVAVVAGKIPMYFNGSWFASSLNADKSPVKGKMDAIPFPLVEGGKGNTAEFFGGTADAFMVSANTKHKEEAVKALKYITENFSKEIYMLGGGLPAWKASVDESKIDPLIVKVNKLSQTATSYVLWWDTLLGGERAEAHLDLVSNLFGNKIDPKGYAAQMQARVNK